MIWISYILFVISRLIFLNPANVFFDSKEYISRWSDSSFLNAMTTGHPPLHSGYVATFWPLFQLAKLFGLKPTTVVLLGQIGLSLLTVILFYKALSILVDKKMAKKSAILFSILPIFWIVNEAVMMETTYLFYWVASLFCLSKFILAKKVGMKWIVWSSAFWVMSFLTHSVVIMWIPLFIFLVWTKNKKRFGVFVTFGVISLLVASLINGYLLSVAHKTDLLGGLYWLYAAKFGEHAWFSLSIDTFLRYGRNWLMPLGYNNTWLVLIMASMGLVMSLKKNKWLFGLALFWILPSFITNQWWDSLFFGRHALIASLALAMMVATYLNSRAFKLFSGLILVISLSALTLLNRPIPYLEVAKELNSLQPGGLIIDSHFARPQTDGEYFGQMIFVDEPGWDVQGLQNTIDGYLSLDKPVYVTGQALGEPYGLFCGPYLHNLSLSYRNKLILPELFRQYSFSKIKTIDSTINLDVYQVTSGQGDYPDIKKLDNNRRRVDWLDPLRVGTYFLFK